jgi:hypothetical protein
MKMDYSYETQYRYAVLDAFSDRETASVSEINEMIDANLEEWRQRKSETGKVATARTSAMLMLLEDDKALSFVENRDGDEVYAKAANYYAVLYRTIVALKEELDLDSPWSGEIDWTTFDERTEEKYSHVEVEKRILTIFQLNKIGDYLFNIGKMDEIEEEDLEIEKMDGDYQLKYAILDLAEQNRPITLTQIKEQVGQTVAPNRIIAVLSYLEATKALASSRNKAGEEEYSKGSTYPAQLHNASDQVSNELNILADLDNFDPDDPNRYEIGNKELDVLLTKEQIYKLSDYLIGIDKVNM